MEPGELVCERFEILAPAGAGGMGTVFRARDRLGGTDVALKLVLGHDGLHHERFVQEAQMLAGLRHPGIVRYVAHGTTPAGEPYLAMEWIEGETVSQRLSRAGMTVTEAVALVRCVAEALAEAHRRGIVHRDIKPQNLILQGGEIERVKLLDFGIARPLGQARWLTHTGVVLGTPGFMAPEQARGAREIDARADVFALGCVLYCCLTGVPPFHAEHVMAVLAKVLVEDPPPASRLRPEVPTALDALCAHMLSKDPAGRPADAGVVADALSRLGELGSSPVAGATLSDALTASEQRLLCVVLAGASDMSEWSTWTPQDQRSFDQKLRDTVQDHGGALERLADGSVLVTVGGGGAATDQSSRAARCALRLRLLLPEVSLCVATGRAVVGGQLPVGDVIDRAVGLLGAGREGKIRLDDVTAGLLGERFLVGRDQHGIYLKAERDAVDSARLLLGRPTPCIGRDRELSVLEGLYAECAAEPVARAVLVTAPAGGGKSRLRHEFLRRLHDRGPLPDVLVGRGDPVRAGSPFGLLAEAIGRAAGLVSGEAPAQKQEKLRARLARTVPAGELDRLAALLAELGGLLPPDGRGVLGPLLSDARALGDAMRLAFCDWLAAECRERPILFVLEDLHWGDRPTVDFLGAALGRLADRPFLVLALARPEVHQLFPALWQERDPQEIRLAALTRKSAERLVRAVLGPGVASETVALVVERGEGNPFYIEELIRAVAEGRSGELPDSILGMVQARFDALGPEPKRLLRAASVFGGTFWEGGLEKLVGDIGPATRRRALDELVARELVVRRDEATLPGESEYTFRHALVREAAYAMLTAADRALGHRLAGAWLEQAGLRDANALAEHFDRGGEPLRAASWYRRGAEQAMEGDDLGGAIERAGRALALGADGPDKFELLRLQAEAHNWRAEHAQAERCAAEALALATPGTSAWFRAADERFLALARGGKMAAAARQVEHLLSITPEPEGAQAHIGALSRAAIVCAHTGVEDVAKVVLGRVEALADGRTLPPGLAGRLHTVRARLARDRGDVATCLAEHEAAIAAQLRASNLREVCLTRMSLAATYGDLGAAAEAEAVMRSVRQDAERMSLVSALTVIDYGLGFALLYGGRAAEAQALLERVVEAAHRVGDLAMEASARLVLGRARLAQGDAVGAERHLRIVLDAGGPLSGLRAPARAWCARALLAQGRVEEARALSREAMAALRPSPGFAEGESLLRLVEVETLEAAGEKEAARAALSEAARRLLERAARIQEPWRTRFLGGTPENACTLERAREAGLPTAAS